MSSPNQSMNLGQSSAPQSNFVFSIQETQESSATLESRLKANQVEASQEKLQTEAEENSVVAIVHKHKKLELRKSEGKTEKIRKVEHSVLVRKEEADTSADEFSKREENRPYLLIGLDKKLLSQLVYEELGTGITQDTTSDKIIEIVRQRMSVDGKAPEVAIVNKALEFLLEMTEKKMKIFEGEERERLEKIYSHLETAQKNYERIYEVELRLTPELIEAAQVVSQSTKEGIRQAFDRYRDIVHNPPDLQVMRKNYEEKGYRAMVLELKGLSSYLGGNFKRKNLEHPELARLASAAKKLQALLGVFRQSKIQLSSMESYLALNGVLEAA